MPEPKKRVPLKRRFIALLFVVAGAVCLIAGRENADNPNTLMVSGAGLMVAGIIIRLTGKRT